MEKARAYYSSYVSLPIVFQANASGFLSLFNPNKLSRIYPVGVLGIQLLSKRLDIKRNTAKWLQGIAFICLSILSSSLFLQRKVLSSIAERRESSSSGDTIKKKMKRVRRERAPGKRRWIALGRDRKGRDVRLTERRQQKMAIATKVIITVDRKAKERIADCDQITWACSLPHFCTASSVSSSSLIEVLTIDTGLNVSQMSLRWKRRLLSCPRLK